ncbi:hypothetical protein D3C75_1192600 [compost metagenome]
MLRKQQDHEGIKHGKIGFGGHQLGVQEIPLNEVQHGDHDHDIYHHQNPVQGIADNSQRDQ